MQLCAERGRSGARLNVLADLPEEIESIAVCSRHNLIAQLARVRLSESCQKHGLLLQNHLVVLFFEFLGRLLLMLDCELLETLVEASIKGNLREFLHEE